MSRTLSSAVFFCFAVAAAQGAVSRLVAQPRPSSPVAAPAAGEWQITVTLQGVDASRAGVLRCSLYKSARGFPTDANLALSTTTARGTGGQRTCVFRVAGAGDYAVAVWGTTRNITHTFRAPSFDESKFTVSSPRWRIALRMHY
jgi:uncharacterized protein (DUF2141 family)